ncbi:MAG: cupin domain-containing protein [Phycisphaerales bacterium]
MSLTITDVHRPTAPRRTATPAPTFVTPSTARRLMVLGEEIRVRLSGNDTNGALALFEQSAKPGFSVPMHVHEREDETFHVIEGSIHVTVVRGSERLEIFANAGDTVFAPRGLPHTWTAIGDRAAKLIILTSPAGMEHMFADLDRLPPGPPDFAKVKEVCARYGVRVG